MKKLTIIKSLFRLSIRFALKLFIYTPFFLKIKLACWMIYLVTHYLSTFRTLIKIYD